MHEPDVTGRRCLKCGRLLGSGRTELPCAGDDTMPPTDPLPVAAESAPAPASTDGWEPVPIPLESAPASAPVSIDGWEPDNGR